ncbi:unnamed protein product, partial [Allacma fusca]
AGKFNLKWMSVWHISIEHWRDRVADLYLKNIASKFLSSKMGDIKIRPAQREDCLAIWKLKKELADHQDMGSKPYLSVEELQRDGFDVAEPYFKCLLAEEITGDESRVVAYALYFYAYAAFEGKTLFLEDLIVTKNIRGKGIGSKMFQALGKICVAENLAGMKLEVLNTNESAIKFYDKNSGYNTNIVDHFVTEIFEKPFEMVEKFLVRPAERKDCQDIEDMIKELAVYEKLGDKPQLSAADLERDGFDSNPPFYRCLVIEIKEPDADERSLAGYALYFYTYSTWEGKAIHMEDFYVSPKYRHQGLGVRMLKTLAKIGVDGDFCRLTLECLDWNEPARKLYEKLEAINFTQTQGWHTYRFVKEVMEKLAADSPAHIYIGKENPQKHLSKLIWSNS